MALFLSMEKQEKESPLLYARFTIPPEEEVKAGLDALKNELPSINNRLYPAILRMLQNVRLEGGEIDGVGMLEGLLAVYDQFAQSSFSPRRPLRPIEVFTRTVQDLPSHLAILVNNTEILNAVLTATPEKIEEIMARIFSVQAAREAEKARREDEGMLKKRSKKGRFERNIGNLVLDQPSQLRLAELSAERHRYTPS